MVKAKVVNFLEEKQKEQGASEKSSAMNESEHLDELLDFLYKTISNTCRDLATKIFESFFDQKPQ